MLKNDRALLEEAASKSMELENDHLKPSAQSGQESSKQAGAKKQLIQLYSIQESPTESITHSPSGLKMKKAGKVCR